VSAWPSRVALAEACKKLAEHPGIEEGMILSTCNRVEILANTKNGAGADLRGFLQNYFHLDHAELDRHLYEYTEQEAVRHCSAWRRASIRW